MRELIAKVYGDPLPERMVALAERVRAKARGADRDPLTPALSPGGGEGGRDPGHDPDLAPALFFGRADPEEPLAAALAQVLEGAEGDALLRGALEPEEPLEAPPPRWSRDQAFAALDAAGGRDTWWQSRSAMPATSSRRPPCSPSRANTSAGTTRSAGPRRARAAARSGSTGTARRSSGRS